MTIRLSEIQITKVTDASTPLLFSGDAFVFDGTKAGGDVSPYMEFKLKEVLISGVIQNGDTAVDPNNPNVDLSASGDDGGFVIDWFPTETVSPTESLDDGGIIIIGGFPTETVRPIESVHHFELLI